MKKAMYCYACEAEHEFRRETRAETFTVRGEAVALDIPTLVCEACGTKVPDEAFGDPVELAFAAYRERHGLLSPERIKQIREQWALSQASLAALLGMSAATVNRYEAGSLQEQTHDELIRACDDRTHMVDLLDRRGHLLTDAQARKVSAAVQAGGHKPMPKWWASLMWLSDVTDEVSVRTGFRRFDFERYAAVVVWLCERVQCVTQTKLNKLLFYADFWHYLAESQSITGTAYRRMPYGPVPVGAETLQDALESSEYVELQPRRFGNGHEGVEICPGPAAHEVLREFAESELAVLQRVVDRLGKLTPSDISDESHKEAAWLETPSRELISYDFARQLLIRMETE